VLESPRQATGLPCNPHTFRRTFACLLRKAGGDTMTIKDLGMGGKSRDDAEVYKVSNL
jgi:integrase